MYMDMDMDMDMSRLTSPGTPPSGTIATAGVFSVVSSLPTLFSQTGIPLSLCRGGRGGWGGCVGVKGVHVKYGRWQFMQDVESGAVWWWMRVAKPDKAWHGA